MGLFLDSFQSGIALLLSGDKELWSIIFLSLRCTFVASLAACILGIPLAFKITYSSFFGKRGVILMFNTLQSVPTVVIGLFLYIFISRRGVFGPLDLLYSPAGIMIGQFLLVLPLMVMYVLSSLSRLDTRYYETALTLGASGKQAAVTVLREARFALVGALCAVFGRGIAEVGISMMLGGNIRGYTRTMTTAMALEYDKGEFTLAIALGIVLLLVSLLVNASLAFFQGKGGR